MSNTKLVCLSQEMMRFTEIAAKKANRTPTEQIEYWVLLGREANKTISQDDILDILCGIAKIKVEEVSV